MLVNEQLFSAQDFFSDKIAKMTLVNFKMQLEARMEHSDNPWHVKIDMGCLT